MKKYLFIFFILFSVPAWSQYTQNDFSNLHQLEGKWEMKTRRGAVVEQWKKVNDSMMVGKSYLVVDTDTVPQESIELRLVNGIITYSPTVFNQNGGRPVSFNLVSATGGKFVFENKNHDFPQRITYQPGEKTLWATIGGKTADGEKEIPFNYIKVE